MPMLRQSRERTDVMGVDVTRRAFAKRRGFLGAIAALLVNVFASPRAIGGMVHGDVEELMPLAEKLLDAYPPRQSLASIGVVYWQENGVLTPIRGCSPPEAFSSFLTHIDWTEANLRNASKAHIRDRIEAASIRDFSNGRIVQVQGWLLSETETRLCVLAASQDRRCAVG